MKRNLTLTYTFESADEMTAFLAQAEVWREERLAQIVHEKAELRARVERAILVAQCDGCLDKATCAGPDSMPSRPFCTRGEEAVKAEYRRAGRRGFTETSRVVKDYLGDAH